MKRFLTLCSVSMQQNLYYRASFLGSIISPLVLLAGQVLLWGALYRGTGGARIGVFERPEMFTYILLSFLINNLLTWRSENQLARKIQSGAIVTECVRPMPFIVQNIADMTGSMVLQSGVNIAIVAVLFAVFSRSLVFPTALGGALSLACLLLAVLLRMLIVSTFSLLCFYTTQHVGITWTRQAITDFFAGAVIPVALFPGWLSTLAYATPFPYMLSVPITLYLGQPLPMGLPMIFLVQLGWVAGFFVVQGLMWRSISRNIIIAGG